MKKLVVLTGAGISAESGIKTFRESGGLWEEYDVTEVASPMGWALNRELVLKFYNDRRKQLSESIPNAGHYGVAALEKYFDVHVITQNIDNLHERAGSTKILHLHGELTKARSTVDPSLVYDISYNDINPGDKCEKGSQLRPHVVWFGEQVDNFSAATVMAAKADIFIVVGTSLVVYPAAGLIDFVPDSTPKYLIDPDAREIYGIHNLTVLPEKAGKGVPELVEKLLTTEN